MRDLLSEPGAVPSIFGEGFAFWGVIVFVGWLEIRLTPDIWGRGAHFDITGGLGRGEGGFLGTRGSANRGYAEIIWPMLKNLAVFVALAVFVPDVLDFVIRALRKLISLNVVFFF